MLGSITPLGQRGRASSWSQAAVAYAVGSAVSGAALGGLAGWVGTLLIPTSALGPASRLWVLATMLSVGVALDLHLFGLSLPTVRRQVSEDWLATYRPWVYGLGFGLQLGLGVVTIVTTSTVYVTFWTALLSGGAVTGVAIGGAFGLLRALPIAATARISTRDRAVVLAGKLRRWDGPSRRLALAGQAIAALAAMGAALR